jgi:2-keto-4-pentenoate hydratase
MGSDSKITNAADLLYKSASTSQPIAPVRDLIGAQNIDMAYAVQEINVAKRMRGGDKVTGKKIGLTSFAVQEQLGVDQPDYGVLFNTMEVKNGSLPFSELMQPKAETEIAFVMAEDLDGDINISDLIGAIDYAVVAIEIVGSRVADWNIKITDTIADNASASHYILGDQRKDIDDLNLVDCKMTLTKNDTIASEGTGAACMDNPLNAALWLAQKMAKQGNPLRKGEVLLSGALGPMVAIEQGDEFVASIEGLGSVSLKIT